MALRIGQSQAASQPAVLSQEEEALPLPEEAVTEEAPVLPMADSGGRVDPEVARYLESNYRCFNCVHFIEPGECQIVAGIIDPEAVCSLHTPDGEMMETELHVGTEDELQPEGPPESEGEEAEEDQS